MIRCIIHIYIYIYIPVHLRYNINNVYYNTGQEGRVRLPRDDGESHIL